MSEAKITPRTFVVILAQLALVCGAVGLLEIEQNGKLPQIAALVVGGFAVHTWLPFRLKSPFFLALSLVALWMVTGTHLPWLLGIGLGLFAICHLPLSMLARGLLLIVAGVALAFLRGGLWQASWAGGVIPLLASMFMFRIILYLQDQKLADSSVSWWRRLSYFFMLPNGSFPLFPIIDYNTFRRSFYERPAALIYQKGVHWMARGVLHLLAYRLVYHLLLPPSWEVTDATSLLLFIVSGYALYLRISGQFHLIVGILCLFGFDLPETHKKYFLASSFNNYWRRVNIYWKDFIEKVVFYPVFLRLRRSGIPQPLLVAILITFTATWLFHSYQWFWLRGHFPVTVPDIIFWGVLGACVAANSLWETARGRKGPRGDGFDVRGAVLLSAQTLSMFVFLALLWSLWDCVSPLEWWKRMALLGEDGGTAALYVAGFVVAALGGGTLAQYVGTLEPIKALQRRTDPGSNPTMTLLLALGLFGLGAAQLGGVGASTRLAHALDLVTHERLNEQDQVAQVRGYYENLLTRQNVIGELWRSEVEMPADWISVPDSEFSHDVGEQIAYELYPSMTGKLKRVKFSTNSHGLRDQEYSKAKPPGTYRIAILGSSYTMGSGVADDQVYETLVEQQLNTLYAGGQYRRYEILNFAVGGYTHAHQVAVYQDKVRQFSPDLVILADHTTEGNRVVHHFALRPILLLKHPNPEVRAIADQAGIYKGIDTEIAEGLLSPFKGRLSHLLFNEIVTAAEADGAKVAWFYVPLTRDDMPNRESILPLREDMAVRCGMITLTAADAYGDHTQEELAVAPWDEHPSAEGQQMLADSLLRELQRNEPLLQLGLTR